MTTLMRQINVISRCAASYRGEKFKDLKLCAAHHSYIINICKKPGISQEELARHICVDKSNVARQVFNLENLGYIKRIQSQKDKRVIEIYPTSKALEILPYVKEVVKFWNEYVTQDLSDEELKLLMKMMDKLVNRAKGYFENQEVNK